MDQMEWLSKFRIAETNGDMYELHRLRRDIYADTIAAVQRGCYCVDGSTIELPRPDEMMNNTILYSAPITTDSQQEKSPVIVEVINSDSLAAGYKLLKEDLHPAVLNFANRQTPGGGVLGGSGAQEENIFRRSNLFMSLYQFHDHGISFDIPQRAEQYPLDRNYGGVYSPAVTVLRGLESEGYPFLAEPYQVGIITVAALNRPPLQSPDLLAADMIEPTKRKMRTIFRIALTHGHDSIVLGAFGCGSFRNPPSHIARLFHEIMDEPEFLDRFKKIVFAIYDRKVDHLRSKTGNLAYFQKEFE